ncbi:MAG TPA: hypothetical protein VGP26_10365 [Actinophytocola sp.]|jgi:hypothetical protein|nr:hypothetical protein [Actinophytocola sp.]
MSRPDVQTQAAEQPDSTLARAAVPRRRGLVVLFGVLAGFLLSAVWSASFVDTVIGRNVADGILGHDAAGTAIAGGGAGVTFALVSGLAGTFTACNIAAFAAVAPFARGTGGQWSRAGAALRPLLWLGLGMVVVSAAYGVVVGLVGTGMPQFDTAPNTPGHLTARTTQSMVVFGVVGLAMTYLGLAAAGIVRDPFARLAARFPRAPLVFFGALVGAFLIGRPFPLFRKLFRDAAESHDPLYGAASFVLQSIGNILVLGVVLLLVTWLAGRRLQRWFAADPRRLTVLSAVSLLAAGAFTVLYWDVRLLAMRDIIPWYPLAPWA